MYENGANRARVRSTNIAENVVQLAHPQLQTYVRVESQQRSDGHYELDISIKDLKSGKIMARPQLIAKPGELAQIEVGQEGGGYKLSVRATPN